MVFSTTWIGEGGVDIHLILKAIVGENVCTTLGNLLSVRINKDFVNHLTWVIQTDDGLFRHCGIVTTTIGIDNGTAMNIEECLAYMRRSKFMVTGSHFHIILLGIINSLGTLGS